MCFECGETMARYTHGTGITPATIGVLHYGYILVQMPVLIVFLILLGYVFMAVSWFPLGSILLKVSISATLCVLSVSISISFMFFQSKYIVLYPFEGTVAMPDTGDKLSIVRSFYEPPIATRVNASAILKNLIIVG
jgi:hypothetical protein